jgi:hypothetical protein
VPLTEIYQIEGDRISWKIWERMGIWYITRDRGTKKACCSRRHSGSQRQGCLGAFQGAEVHCCTRSRWTECYRLLGSVCRSTPPSPTSRRYGNASPRTADKKFVMSRVYDKSFVEVNHRGAKMAAATDNPMSSFKYFHRVQFRRSSSAPCSSPALSSRFWFRQKV